MAGLSTTLTNAIDFLTKNANNLLTSGPTFNIEGLQISEDFPTGFLQSGSPIANALVSFSQKSSFPDLVRAAVNTYHDILQTDFTIKAADTNVLTGNPGFSLVLTEGDNLIGTIGVSGLSGPSAHLVGFLRDLLLPHS